MYFPLSKLHGWGKRSAVQPKTIYSEIPLFFMSEYLPVFCAYSFGKMGGAGYPAPPSAYSSCPGEDQRYLEQVAVHQQL